MKNLTLIIAFLFIGINSAEAQETTISKTLPTGCKTVTGVVTDIIGWPLPSANVKIKGSKDMGVQTNIDGKFAITAKVGDKLEITYVGMKTQVMTISNMDRYIIMLEDDIIDTGLVIYWREPMRGVASIYMFGY
ncbi:carboxypeptidase-like regulatory domain-containing protein [uncultured Flavobacterium sp.]|uniref:carboxypeptidase-like regulatory domain-containing protein n=1 Tax=uncultured Flavobacterium sp. TaxID=165435 RepID=UPI0025D87E81|nr:carboxypeptidase-like regulatory domain-containing protein [uncultured Flavobacterium sp.]